VVGGGVAVVYVKYLKAVKEKEAEEKKQKTYGKAALGGPFSLIDHNGERRHHTDFFGQWVLLYFGFTFCPDICPEELQKMTEAIHILDKTAGLPTLQPLFITVDTKRDSPEKIKKYLADFHPRLLGLTGTEEEVHQATKAYRVYYSIGPSDNPDDYLVDHTIIMYLVDPDGNFREYFGQNRTAEEISHSIANHMLQYQLNRGSSP
jgi:protein SCO1/2